MLCSCFSHLVYLALHNKLLINFYEIFGGGREALRQQRFVKILGLIWIWEVVFNFFLHLWKMSLCCTYRSGESNYGKTNME